MAAISGWVHMSSSWIMCSGNQAMNWLLRSSLAGTTNEPLSVTLSPSISTAEIFFSCFQQKSWYPVMARSNSRSDFLLTVLM